MSLIETAKKQMKDAEEEILAIRAEQKPSEGNDQEKGYLSEEVRCYQQTQSAHELALRAVRRGITETKNSEEFVHPGAGYTLASINFIRFIRQFEDISLSIHRILENKYLDTEEKTDAWSRKEIHERTWINKWEEKIENASSTDVKHLREDYLTPPKSKMTK